MVNDENVQTYDADASVDSERLEFEAAQLEAGALHRPIQLSMRELVLGIAALVVWFALFSGGILIGTESYRKALETPDAIGPTMANWAIVCVFWTITNMGILSCVAALLGAMGRRTRFTSRTDPLQRAIDASRPRRHGLATYYVSALMRGFGIYALVLGGILVLATESLIAPTQATYMRLAPTVSIISFYAGYDPSMFAGLLDRVKMFLQAGSQSPN